MVNNCTQKVVGLVLKTEVSVKTWQLYNFLYEVLEVSVLSFTWKWDN